MKATKFFIVIILIQFMYSGKLLSQQVDTLRNFHPKWLTCKLTSPIFIAYFEKVPVKSLPVYSARSEKKELFSLSGDLSYQHFERNGSSDNLFFINSASDIASLRMNVLYKQSYPYSISFRYNKTSPFQMDDRYEIAFNFDDRGYRQLSQEKITNSVKNKFLKNQQQRVSNYERIFRQYQSLKQMLNSPTYLRKLMDREARTGLNEAIPAISPNVSANAGLSGVNDLNKQSNPLPDPQSILKGAEKKIEDTIKNFSASKTNQLTKKLRSQADSLEHIMKKIEDSISTEKKELQKSLDSVNAQMAELGTSTQIKKYADKGVDSVPRNNWADILMKLNLRAGKFILNQSELTISNIFLHGISVKYGDDKFIVISGGVYDFAFRQVFNFRGSTIQHKTPSVLGVKIGKTDGRNLQAINFYIGKKSKDGSITNELRTVAGLSLERNFYLSRNLEFGLEIAKSTTHQNNSVGKDEQIIKDLFASFSTRTIGLNSSLKAYIPKTKTDVQVTYRYWGQQFESFNAAQYFNPQNNLSASLVQPLFKRKLFLTGGLKYTDFNTSGISNNIKSKAFFASATATLNLKRFPVINIGYYPGSQLYCLDQVKLYEYYYYILNTTASHNFQIGKLPIQTVFSFNKFFNQYSDTLVAGSQSSYNLFVTARGKNFSYAANFTKQEIQNTSLTTVEGGLNYFRTKLRLGGSLKLNYLHEKIKKGYSISMGWTMNKIGTINFLFDKSFLPERTGLFVPVKTAQIQIIKPLKFRIWQ